VPKGQRARIEVTPEDAATLRLWAGSRRGERRLAERAQVILLSSEGASLAEISGRSPDPEFEAKQAAILGLYLDPPINALVVCVDEKRQIQALDRTLPELHLQAGSPRRLTANYASERAKPFAWTYTGKPLAA
jgi:hypothetical protein